MIPFKIMDDEFLLGEPLIRGFESLSEDKPAGWQT